MLWSHADLHIHTTYSDGTATPEEVVAYVAAHTDLRVIAITDHDTIAGALAARRLASAYGIEVIVGEEVSTREGHLLALFLEQPLPPGQAAAATIAAAHAQGALCIPAHPYGMVSPSLGRAGLLAQASGPDRRWPVDALETFNASLWRSENNRKAVAAARLLGLPCIGGSDSHELVTIGSGYTRFPGQSTADLRAAILHGTTAALGRRWGLGPNTRLVSRWLWASTATALRPVLFGS